MQGKHLKDFMTEEEHRILLSHHHHLSGKDNPSFGKIWMCNRKTKEIIFVSEDEAEEQQADISIEALDVTTRLVEIQKKAAATICGFSLRRARRTRKIK